MPDGFVVLVSKNGSPLRLHKSIIMAYARPNDSLYTMIVTSDGNQVEVQNTVEDIDMQLRSE
jgi:hypothetical protein